MIFISFRATSFHFYYSSCFSVSVFNKEELLDTSEESLLSKDLISPSIFLFKYLSFFTYWFDKDKLLFRNLMIPLKLVFDLTSSIIYFLMKKTINSFVLVGHCKNTVMLQSKMISDFFFLQSDLRREHFTVASLNFNSTILLFLCIVLPLRTRMNLRRESRLYSAHPLRKMSEN